MKLLVIAAHPDDVEIGMGGFVALNVQHGNEVNILYLTSGEHGVPGMEDVSAIREIEALNAAKILGSEIVAFWRLPDGGLSYSDGLRDRIAREIEIQNPDVIFVHHERDAHIDHKMAGLLVREALKTWVNKPPECLTFEIWTPHSRVERVVNISNVIDIKIDAIRAHKSQIERQAFDDAAKSLARYRGVMNGKCEYAEVFGRMRLDGQEGMRITIVLLTYAPSIDHPRAQYARTTLNSTLDLLDPGPYNTLSLHIADDGSDPQHVRELVEIARKHGLDPTVTNSERGGYGQSYNLACQVVHSSTDLVLPLEDDWELTKPLKLEYLAKALDENLDIRSIRLGYLGITQPLKGTVAFRSGMTYLLLDPDSPEPHVFCGHPRLETVEYQRDIGAWPVGLRPGETEWEIAHRWAARVGVAWPLDINLPASQDWGCYFGHIGSVSYNQLEANTLG